MHLNEASDIPLNNLKMGLPGGLQVKNLPVNTGDEVSICGLKRSPREGNGKTIHYSCLENHMDRGAWWAKSMGLQKSWTQFSN